MKKSVSQRQAFPCYLFLIAALSLFAIGPLLTRNWVMVGESIEQILRVIELHQGIQNGDFYPR